MLGCSASPHQKALSKASELTIGTRIIGTPVYFLLTVGASEIGGTFTGIAGPLIALPAGASIEAGGVSTGQGAMFTM